MAISTAHLIHHLRRLVARPAAGPATDAALLDRWIQRRDEDAFAALVARHGPMVLQVCRRVLGDAHAAEDCMQAAFLVLACKASSVRPPEAAGAWLHSVARRVALKARAAEARRRLREAGITAPCRPTDPLDQLTARELLGLIDEEVQRLPEVYRLPVVLCFLEGRSQQEAARLLGWTDGSVKGRLERGRARLRARLARRDIGLPAVLLAAGVGEATAAAALPTSLAAATARTAVAFTVGQGTPGVEVVGEAAALARQILGGMIAVKVKLVTALVLTGGLIAAGAGLFARPRPAAEAAKGQPTAQPVGEAATPEPAPPVQRDFVGDPLPAGAVARMGTIRLRHGPRVHAAVFAADGKTLVTLGQDGFARVWDAVTGAEVRQFRPEGSQVSALARSAEGAVVALAGSKGNFRLWDIATGQAAGAIMRYAGPATWSLSSDAKAAIAANTTDWNTIDGKESGDGDRSGPATRRC